MTPHHTCYMLGRWLAYLTRAERKQQLDLWLADDLHPDVRRGLARLRRRMG